MKTKPLFLSALLSLASISAGPVGNAPSGDADWPRWRGPYETGMARGDAPTTWSDTKNIKWKVPIPGRGHSSPVLWGDQIFITTAIPIGAEPEGGDPPALFQGLTAHDAVEPQGALVRWSITSLT